MNIYTILKKFGAGVALLVLVIAAYLLWARSVQLHWGATVEWLVNLRKKESNLLVS